MFLDRIKEYAVSNKIAFTYSKDTKTEYSYAELDAESDALASYFKRNLSDGAIVVYGHKSHLMLTCFLGAVKSGRPYCPIDINTPAHRVSTIIDKIKPSVVIALEELDIEIDKKIDAEKIKEIIKTEKLTITTKDYVKPDDLYYIIYTSGSTGNPKGVMITYNNLNCFIDWATSLVDIDDETVFLNQAPYSFDLSVMDLYMGLGSGSKIYSLDKEVQSDYKELLKELSLSNATHWVSTPSFADVCLADRTFNEELMPKLKYFLFCGEVLTVKTCKRLKKRFPNSKIINTYGPTESTVAITSIEITDEVLEKYDPLPIGLPKPGTELLIDSEKLTDEENVKGEFVILGNTVSKGYYDEAELTAEVFKEVNYKGKTEVAYYTGDLGYISEGQYFCAGRKDNQIKMHGYRIELGDIEAHLCGIEDITQCAVIPHYVSGKVQRLTAYVVYTGEIEDEMSKTLEIKTELQNYLQPYMIPQRFVYMDSLPMNTNGKVDRKALMEIK